MRQPQSATIQGILKDMYETFVTDLESATMTEATQNREFETLLAIKTEELGELEATKATKEAEKAEAEANHAESTQSYDDTNLRRRQTSNSLMPQRQHATRSTRTGSSATAFARKRKLASPRPSRFLPVMRPGHFLRRRSSPARAATRWQHPPSSRSKARHPPKLCALTLR